MKRFFLSILLMTCVMSMQAQNITTPQPSPTQTIKQNFSTGNIELSYSRPSLKGRKIGTDLAPYGKVWRTGANGATTIQFSDDVMIGGTDIKAGKYGLLTIPNEGEWTVIITKDLNVNQPSLYNQDNDVVRVKVAPKKVADKVENFTINFVGITGNSCNLQLTWGNTAVDLPITTRTDERVMKQIDNVFNQDNKPYFAAASYYYDNGKDLGKAKEWVDKATADPANAKAFYMFMLKARIYQKMGDKAGAKANAEKTITLATEAKNEDFVKQAQTLIATL